MLSSLLEALTTESDVSAEITAQRQQKHAVLSQALLELRSFPSLLQCYNAAYYFVTASTAPRPVPLVGTTVGSDTNSVMSAVDPNAQAATVEMAITPAGEFVICIRLSCVVFIVFLCCVVLEGFDCCEQLSSTLALTLAVTSAAHPMQLRDAALVDVTLFLQLLQPLLDLVTHTTPMLDSTAKGKFNVNY